MSTKKKLVGAPQDWWDAWEEEAAAQGLSRDAWMGQCCNANLKSKVANKLSDRPTRGRPKLSEKSLENEPKKHTSPSKKIDK